MKITLRSSGGFTGKAGATLRTVDVDSLPDPEAKGLRRLVEAADIASLPARLTKAAPQPWDFVHELEIENDGEVQKVAFHDDAAPSGLKALLTAISDQAEPGYSAT